MQGAGLEKQGAGPVNGDTARQGEEGEERNAAGCLNLHANNDMHKQVTNDDNDAVSHSTSHSHSHSPPPPLSISWSKRSRRPRGGVLLAPWARSSRLCIWP